MRTAAWSPCAATSWTPWSTGASRSPSWPLDATGTAAAFRPTGPVADPRLMCRALPEVVHAAQLPELLADLAVDVVHDNTLAGPLVAATHGLPTVVTAHGPVYGDLGAYYRTLSGRASLVALSRAQREGLPTARWAATVPNGVRPDRFPFHAAKGEYAVFLGRMSPDKGPVWAIDAARAAGIPLVMAAKCREDDEVAYFEHAVRPRLGGDVEWIGEVGGRRKVELLADARCLLFPIDWEEPFGLVMIEAMACGTPVVALRRGAVPEVVDHGARGGASFETPLPADAAVTGRVPSEDTDRASPITSGRRAVAPPGGRHRAGSMNRGGRAPTSGGRRSRPDRSRTAPCR